MASIDDATAHELMATATRLRFQVRRLLSKYPMLQESASDLLNSAITAAVGCWQRLRLEQKERSLQKWLMTVVQNKVRDLVDKRVPTPIDVTESPLANALPCKSMRPDLLAEQREEAARISHRFGALTPSEREFLCLRFYQGKSHQEIAAALQLPSVGASRELQCRILSRMRGLRS